MKSIMKLIFCMTLVLVIFAAPALAQRTQQLDKKDIFNILQTEHNNVKVLFQKLAAKPDTNTYNKLFTELGGHMYAEETQVYPRLRQMNETQDMIDDSIKEHNKVKELMKDLNGISFGTREWQSKLADLQDAVVNHVQKEEGQLFQKAGPVLTREQREEIGRAYLSDENAQKTEIKRQIR